MPETPQPAEPCPCICHMGPRPRGVLHSRACCPSWNGNLDGPAGDSLPHIEARVRRDERERIAAVRDEEMTALRRQRDTAEAGIAHLEKRIVYLEGRAEKAEAALARARTLAGAMLHEAYCAGHPDAGRWRAEYAAIDSPEPR